MKIFRENSISFLLQHFRHYLFRYIETNTIEKVAQHGEGVRIRPTGNPHLTLFLRWLTTP